MSRKRNQNLSEEMDKIIKANLPAPQKLGDLDNHEIDAMSQPVNITDKEYADAKKRLEEYKKFFRERPVELKQQGLDDDAIDFALQPTRLLYEQLRWIVERSERTAQADKNNLSGSTYACSANTQEPTSKMSKGRNIRVKSLKELHGRPIQPNLETVSQVVKEAIARTHSAGLSTAHNDAKGRTYLLYPDGRREYVGLPPVVNDKESPL